MEERPLCKRRLRRSGGPGARRNPSIHCDSQSQGPMTAAESMNGKREKKKNPTSISTPCFPPPASLPAVSTRHKVMGEGGVGACESGCKSGWRLYYLYTPGLQDKEGRSESPPFRSPSVAPIRSSAALISLPPPPRAGRCGGGNRLSGSSVAKVRLLTSEPLLLSMNSRRRLGTALATRLQTSSPPVGHGEGGVKASALLA